MKLIITDLNPGERPQVTMPVPEFYQYLKEEGVRKMVSKHYDCLRQSDVKQLFPTNDEAFELAKKYSADFFVQVLGGPPYYQESRGNPALVIRHKPFAITPEARLSWLGCYQKVLLSMDLPEDILLSFWNYLDVFSKWMVNAIRVKK